MKEKIAVAVSGGIDSAVTACLLKDQGYETIGIHFITGYESDPPLSSAFMEQMLRIPVEIIDCTDVFQHTVVRYFIQSYQSGKTPNPCLVCNPEIKFTVLRDMAFKMGASRLATGHYARILQTNRQDVHLLRGLDTEKDQSYFLAFLDKRQLASACFPLGGFTKKKVREMAGKMGLTPLVRDESQDVCFIRNTTYADFLMAQPGFTSTPGLIEHIDGTVIGEHNGLHHFTVGQRRGINCPGPEPYYVIRLDTQNNRLIVGSRHHLKSRNCRVNHVHWIHNPPQPPFDVHIRIRYRHQAVPSTIYYNPDTPSQVVVRFKAPQSAVTPGQGAVFYVGDEVIGAGWIESGT